MRYLDDETKIYSFILDELEKLIDLIVLFYRKRNIFQRLPVPIESTVNNIDY